MRFILKLKMKLLQHFFSINSSNRWVNYSWSLFPTGDAMRGEKKEKERKHNKLEKMNKRTKPLNTWQNPENDQYKHSIAGPLRPGLCSISHHILLYLKIQWRITMRCWVNTWQDPLIVFLTRIKYNSGK